MKLNRRRNGKGQRGQAMVETVVALIVLIPIFLYALFLDDLLRHYLDQQEAVNSTVWDLTTMDYHKGKTKTFGTKAGEFAELMFCDHTSAYSSWTRNDCEDSGSDGHHQALGAHVCWMVNGGKLPRCKLINKTFGQGYSHNTVSGFGSAFTTGGQYECSGRLGVSNYLIPQDLFSQFSQVDAIGKKKMKQAGTVYSDMEGTAEAFVFPMSRFRILTDTWAMNETPDVDRNSEAGDLYDRTENIYTSTFTAWPAANAANNLFLVQSMGQMLLGPTIYSKDKLDKPNVALKHAPDNVAAPPRSDVDQHNGNGRYYATPSKDWAQNRHEKTRQARGGYYMGCDKAEKTDCQ